MPRLQRAAEYREETDVIHRLMGMGAYGLLFAGMVWNAFWKARVGSGDPEAFYIWWGTIDDATCITCEGRIGNIYRASNLPGIPGDRSTKCDGLCRCMPQELSPEEAMMAEETF